MDTLREKLIELDEKDIPDFPDNTVLEAYRGSIAHNMYVPNLDPNSVDDVDMMAVYMAPKEFYIGLGMEKCHEKAREYFIEQYDAVYYEFRKFVRMLINSNPNVLGMLWLEDKHYFKKGLAGQMLIDNRDLFSSKRAKDAFVGYAVGQLKRMTHHNCQGYMGIKRKALVEKYGYDCKNAAHCIRLLRMGLEFINTGILNVYRSDAEELLEIKLGKWTKESVDKEAAKLIERLDAIDYKSPLPDEPNTKKIEELVIEAMRMYLGAI